MTKLTVLGGKSDGTDWWAEDGTIPPAPARGHKNQLHLLMPEIACSPCFSESEAFFRPGA